MSTVNPVPLAEESQLPVTPLMSNETNLPYLEETELRLLEAVNKIERLRNVVRMMREAEVANIVRTRELLAGFSWSEEKHREVQAEQDAITDILLYGVDGVSRIPACAGGSVKCPNQERPMPNAR